MARPPISPMSVNATAPEAFAVLQRRMRVVEESASALVSELEALGARGPSPHLFPSKPGEAPPSHRPLSPVRARASFVGENAVLWRNCDSLVNRMCRLESVVQTLKLNLFRLQTEKELNPKHAAHLEQRMNAMHEEHLQELKVVQLEVMKLRQQLSEAKEEVEKAQEEVQRLSAALEIATATKTNVAIASEELKTTKHIMNRKLHELREQLSQEASLRESLEESQATMLQHVQDMEITVESERQQVQVLQQNCHGLHKDVQFAQERLKKEEERTAQLGQECTHLKADLDSRNYIISQLSEEAKNAQLSFSKEHEENVHLRSEITALRETAEKVQALNDQLNQQCSELSVTLRSVSMENAILISEHQAMLKAEQERMTQKLQEQDLLLDAARANIIGEVQSVQNEKAQLQKDLEALRTEHAGCRQKACLPEDMTTTQKVLLESTIVRLRGELETAVKGRGDLLMEKERLQQEHAQQQVEQVLAELTDSKNKLAYDKGKLQNKVQQLEEEMQSLADARSENNHLHKLNTALEIKYTQLSTELGSVKMNMQQMEAQLKQAQAILEHKEEEVCMAIKSHDEALRETQKIKGHIEAIKEREKQKMAKLQHQLQEAKEDNNKVTAVLENVLVSHSRMQAALEKVQTELGCKDSEITGLRKDRTQSQQKIQRLEAELEQCQAKLLVIDSQHNSQVDPLCKALDVARADNKKLALSLEQALQANSTLQSKLIHTREELDRKEIEHQQLMACREQLIEEAKMEEKVYTERLEALKKQFQTEREATRKANYRESAELKKALEEASSKSAEVSRANRELRQKVMELEKSLVNYKGKLKSQMSQIRQYMTSKANNIQNTQKIKEIESELKQMELIKEQYQKKNYEQALSIQKFMTELTSLQSDMQTLAKNQHEVATQNRQLETQLEMEQKVRQQLENQCQKLEDTVKHLKKCKEETEQKLKEASVESEQITANLEEAHRWFKSKFDSLQLELMKNKQQNIPSEGNYGKEMEKEKTVKLPTQASVNRWETKQQLKFISRKYQAELDRK
uniref:Coiled-coil domain containing 150 n=1 Tax=Pelodiscus sinensis TaxID=13735 RepID=K7GAD6_PELSI|nr:coiled-coil domain-containing protein 150 isoform X3 [Pelodiscus sinensis]XP_006117964.1 coiled-coil domain-containing protein 150 isoform X3 [Pelodiscus sinensis]|eukprot:XP_006117963.1 coiled-coil domain-containing protein 150 isoform X3 [Pelodiscus sinensis]